MHRRLTGIRDRPRPAAGTLAAGARHPARGRSPGSSAAECAGSAVTRWWRRCHTRCRSTSAPGGCHGTSYWSWTSRTTVSAPTIQRAEPSYPIGDLPVEGALVVGPA